MTKTRIRAGLFYSLNWRENRSKNKLVCEHAVAWLGTRGLLLSGKLYKTRKTFSVFTSISNMYQEHVPTSLSSFSRATYFLLAGSELDFFVCFSEMLHQKSVKAALQVYLSNCCPDCKHGESVTIVGLEPSRSNMAAIQRKLEGIPEMRYY